MEDAHTTMLSLAPEHPDCAFFAVYDGHCGQNIARYCGDHLHRRVATSPHFAKEEYAEALTQGFLGVDEDILTTELRNDASGCTAVSCLVTGTGEVYCGNAGDSRCVLSRGGTAVPLSFDHKPTNEGEMKRIQRAGGFVKSGRVNGNLALSRAIGDFEFKKNKQVDAESQCITAKPDVIKTQLQKEDEFLVLACDGIWDVMSNDEVVTFVKNELEQTDDLAAICERAFDKCLAPSYASFFPSPHACADTHFDTHTHTKPTHRTQGTRSWLRQHDDAHYPIPRRLQATIGTDRIEGTARPFAHSCSSSLFSPQHTNEKKRQHKQPNKNPTLCQNASVQPYNPTCIPTHCSHTHSLHETFLQSVRSGASQHSVTHGNQQAK